MERRLVNGRLFCYYQLPPRNHTISPIPPQKHGFLPILFIANIILMTGFVIDTNKRRQGSPMSNYYLISGFVLLMLFLLFQVLSKTLNLVINYLLKIDFLLRTEYDYRREELDVQTILDLDDFS